MVRARGDRLRHRWRAGKARPEIPEGRQGVARGVQAGAKGAAERGQGLRELRFAWRSLVTCVFAVPFRNACFLCHALEIFMNSRPPKLKGTRPARLPQARQNGFAAFPSTSSRETPISSSRRSSSEFKSCNPCRRINQLSMLRTHVESTFRPVRTAAPARGASITDDCDIPNAPFCWLGIGTAKES